MPATSSESSPRELGRALAADPRELAAATRAELTALCRGLAHLSLIQRTGGAVTVAQARAVLDHAHTLFALRTMAAAA